MNPISSRGLRIPAIAAALAVLMSLWAVVRLARQGLFGSLPVHALLVFLIPVVACSLLSLCRPPHLARVLSLCLLLAAALWIVGIPGVAALTLLLLAALALGSLLAKAGGLDVTAGLLPALLAWVLGLAVMGLVLTLAAHFPVNRAPVFAVALVGLIALGGRPLLRHARLLWGWLGHPQPAPLRTWFGVGLFCGAVLLNICYSGLFGFNPDTLAMHLYIPGYEATYGDWSFDFQKYLWALEPIASDLLFGVVYQLSDAIGAQSLNATCLILVAGLIYAVCRRRNDTFDALLPATAWLCVGYVLYLAGSLHAEGFLALFLFAAFLHLESLEPASDPWRSGLVSGVLLAAALATKVLALAMAPVFLLFLLLVTGRRYGAAWLLKFAAVAGAIVLTAGGFQYWYALAETGNPVFFYYNGLFHSPYYPPINLVDNHWTGHYGWNLFFDLSFNTQHFAETGAGTGGLQWFMLLPTALLCLLSKDAHRTRWFALAGLWFAAVVLSSEQYFRYILPALPFLAVLIAEPGLQSGRILPWVYRGVMLLAVALNLVALQGVTLGFADLPIGQVLQRGDGAQQLQEQAPEIAANRMIDGLETGPVNVLYVSHSWGAELRGTAFYQSWYNPELNTAFVRLHRPEAVGPLLAADHIRYVVVNPAYKHVLAAQEVLDYCQAHCQRVATFGTVSLYRVVDATP